MTMLSPTAFLSPSRPARAAKSRSFCEQDLDNASPLASSSSSSSNVIVVAAAERRRYSIRRSASSDARLPSPTDDGLDEEDEEYDDRHQIDECHDDHHNDNDDPPRLGVKRSNRSLSDGDGREMSHWARSGPPGGTAISTEFPSPTAGGGGRVKRPAGRRSSPPLQTIDSERCHVDPLVPGNGGGGGGGRPPRRRRRTSPRRDSAGSHESLVSHYSVDAGKHGFLTHVAPPPPPPLLISSSPSSFASGDSGGGDADSLVFKYSPGLETPPAEYALPATILRVYGENADELLLRESSSNSVVIGDGSFDSSVVFIDGCATTPSQVVEGRKSLAPSSSAGWGANCGTILDARGTVIGESPSSGGKKKSSSRARQQQQQQHRILPYHERKRLTRLRAEEKRRRKAAAKKYGIRAMQTTDDEVKREEKMSTYGAKNLLPDADERSPLNGKTDGYGGATHGSERCVVREKGDIGAGDVDNNKESASNVAKGWFGGLVAMVMGQERKSKTMATDDEEKQLLPKLNCGYETNSYREQAEAFLRRTERERAMMKEQSMRANNLLGGHRSRRSTGSATLHSIVSCSDDDDDDNDDDDDVDVEVSSSDEGSESCYLNDDDVQRNSNAPSNTTVPAAPAQVWKYGLPPTVTDSRAPLAKKKDSSSSKRDRIKRRDRLLQEGCDYRLYNLKRRHDTISTKFRVFVLVSVGVIFVGILGFAFALCVRMLTSL